MLILQQYDKWFQKSGMDRLAKDLEANITRYRKIQYACQHFKKVEPIPDTNRVGCTIINISELQIVPPVAVFECLMKYPPLQQIFDHVHVYAYAQNNCYQIIGFYEDWKKHGLIFKVIDWEGGTPIDEWLGALDRKDIEAYSQLNPLGVVQSNQEGV